MEEEKKESSAKSMSCGDMELISELKSTHEEDERPGFIILEAEPNLENEYPE